MSDISKNLFDLVRSQYTNIVMYDENQDPTQDADKAEMLTIDYPIGDQDFEVYISLINPGAVEIYFPKGIVQQARSIDLKKFRNFIHQLTEFANSNLRRADVYDIPKPQLDLSDLKANAINSTTEDNGLTESLSRLEGSSKTSLQSLGEYRLRIKHSKPVEENSRFRNIKRLYIENRLGERFMLPTTNLAAGRAMLRHYAEGGTIHDDVAQRIFEMARGVEVGKKFLRRVIATDSLNEGTEEIVSIVKDYVLETSEMLRRISGSKSYSYFKENSFTKQTEDTGSRWLENMFTKNTIDEELSKYLPEISKIILYTDAKVC